MTINYRSKAAHNGSIAAIELIIALGTAFLIPTTSSGAEPQDSVVTEVPAMHCSDTTRYAGVIEGIFLSPVRSILIDGSAINQSSWVQSRYEITIIMPASTKNSFTLDIVNGLAPAMVQETLYCSGTQVEPTESGGTIPSTGTNNYNNLLGGVVLILLASIGVFLRKRITTN